MTIELFSFKLYNKPVILLVYSGDIKKASVLINPSLLYSGSNVGGMRVFFNAQADTEEVDFCLLKALFHVVPLTIINSFGVACINHKSGIIITQQEHNNNYFNSKLP